MRYRKRRIVTGTQSLLGLISQANCDCSKELNKLCGCMGKQNTPVEQKSPTGVNTPIINGTKNLLN